MKPKFVLTKWQKRHKVLIEQALDNPFIYQELGYIRRDVYLHINDNVADINEKILRFIDKYSIWFEIESFDVLKKSVMKGGDLDYSLIPKYQPKQPKPNIKKRPQNKLHWDIYKMWIHQNISISDITDKLRDDCVLRGLTRENDINRVSRIIRRMRVNDPRGLPQPGPSPGRRAKSRKKT